MPAAHKYPFHQKNEIEGQISEMQQSGVIRPSLSLFASPVMLVKKSDGSWCTCVDYRSLNQHTLPNKFPIPLINDLLDKLHSVAYFSKLDPSSGYNQMRVVETDVAKTAFRIHNGRYEFLAIPFGLTNAQPLFKT